MRLSDRDIQRYLQEGLIQIVPTPPASAISGVSVDLSLGDSFRGFSAYNRPYIDLGAPRPVLEQTIEAVMGHEIQLTSEQAFFLHPGELVLAVTAETVTLPDHIVGWLDGRSSLARLGLMVHVTAHRIDPGWSGNIVLECYNSGQLPLALRPGMLIGAINFEQTSTPVAQPYNRRQSAKYKNQSGATASRISEDMNGG